MKLKMHLLSVSLLMVLSSVLYGQVELDPLEQYHIKSMVPTLIPYDSITIATDTNSNFSNSAFGTAIIEANPQYSLFIDTMIVQAPNGNVTTLYSGKSIGNRHKIACFNPSVSSDTIRSYTYYKDQMGRDSLLVYKETNNGSLEVFSKTWKEYNPDGTIHTITEQFSIPPFSGNLDTMSHKTFYYSSAQKLDSAIAIVRQGSGRFYYEYSNGELVRMTGYVKGTSGNLVKLLTYRFKNNQQGQVFEIHTFTHVGTGGTSFVNAMRYSLKQNSINLSELKGSEVLSVYPNPASGYLNLKGSDVKGSYEIRDMQGNLMLKSKLPDKRIDISEMPLGHYFLNIKTDKDTYRIQFIKN